MSRVEGIFNKKKNIKPYLAVVICGAGNINTRARARNFDTQCEGSADN